jgi:1,4-alpha-glucan branching enzyme
MPSTLTSVDAEALVRGLHADPFSVLGPHQRGDDLAVRVFRPGAARIEIVGADARSRGAPIRMDQVHHDGLFEVVVANAAREAFDYRLRIANTESPSIEIDDPYRYGPVLTDFDLHLLGEGTHYRAFEKLGARAITHGIRDGVHFAVWAPNAQRVSVVGDFNGWDGRVHPMRRLVPGGYWEIFLPDLGPGDRYKYEVVGADGRIVLKADPCGRRFETPPLTASVVWSPPPYEWRDHDWMRAREEAGQWQHRPMSIYEVHLGSWRRSSDGRPPSYRELAAQLVPYVVETGFTHIELLPVMEHPYGGSWGYQVIGFFAPTSRYGTPDDFKHFVDACHQAGIGVILDWVPGHFPKDQHGLARFDGTALYEHADPRQGEQPDWGTLVFNYGRHEVRSFLISNALYWLDQFHIDGLRVDAVASMLYLDYSRNPGEWVPNRFGGRENLEAVDFIKQLNVVIAAEHPGAIMVAEESTSWPGVSRPVHLGGLGFAYKWNMGWMHDMLDYAAQDPIYRKWHHGKITFSLMYAYSERFVLPFSHDEVVHGKRSMIGKMPGDAWRMHANLRALYGYMFAHPGKKLIFMGGEIGQWREWNHDWQIDWDVLSDPRHAGLQRWVADLNRFYRRAPALWQRDDEPQGFAWIDCNDHEHSVVSLIRRGADADAPLVAVVNFTPVPRRGYRIGVPRGGGYVERLNSDADAYGGSGMGNQGRVVADDIPAHGHPHSLNLIVPPLGFLLLEPEARADVAGPPA